MKNTVMKLFLSLVFLFLVSCSNLQKGKWEYKNGNYKKAIGYFEQVLRNQKTNEDARKYLVLAQSGELTDDAYDEMSGGNVENAIKKLDKAIALDPKNESAKKLMENSLDNLVKEIKNTYLKNEKWGKVLELTDLILKYRPESSFACINNAKAVYNLEDKTYNYKSVMAFKKASKIEPDNAYIMKHINNVSQKSDKFENLFSKYQNYLITENYKGWLNLVHPLYIKEINSFIDEINKNEDAEIKTIKDYFLEVSKDPKKYGSPKGAQVVCVEPLTNSRGFVHFIYKDSPKVLKIEIVKTKKGYKIHKEEDSPIRMSEIQN